MTHDLTIEEAEQLLDISEGADIYGYGLAIMFRKIEKEHPEFITITKAMDPPDDIMLKRPYFGAITSGAGIKAARKVIV